MSVKNDFVKPVIILSLICIFVSGALAVGHNFTQPVIAAAAAERAAVAIREIIPEADGFEPVETSGLPRSITTVYRTTNNIGYIFMMTVQGYVGDIRFVCGINPDGRIIRTAVLSHTETVGLGTPVFEQPHSGQYWGRDKSGIESIAIVSGATVTSEAFKSGLRDAFAAFEIVRAR